MTAHEKDGGPAFPVQDASKWQAHGLTLRDYFAAKAMAALVVSESWELESAKDVETVQTHHIADEAYSIADAMLAARQR